MLPKGSLFNLSIRSSKQSRRQCVCQMLWPNIVCPQIFKIAIISEVLSLYHLPISCWGARLLCQVQITDWQLTSFPSAPERQVFCELWRFHCLKQALFGRQHWVCIVWWSATLSLNYVTLGFTNITKSLLISYLCTTEQCLSILFVYSHYARHFMTYCRAYLCWNVCKCLRYFGKF